MGEYKRFDSLNRAVSDAVADIMPSVTPETIGKSRQQLLSSIDMSGDRQGNTPSPTPEVMTIDDLAAYLQVSKSSLYKLAQDGRVPGQKVGSRCTKKDRQPYNTIGKRWSIA